MLEEQSHFTCRIEEIVPSAPDRYSLTPDTDLVTFSKELLSHLEEAVECMRNIISPRDIVEYLFIKGIIQSLRGKAQMSMDKKDVQH